MVNALKHDFKNEVCTRCGIGDPTPKKPETDQNDVYQIGSVGELYWFAGLVNGDTSVCKDGETQNTAANAVLTADITVTDNLLSSLIYDEKSGEVSNGANFKSWTPIGNKLSQYTGTFDGKGYTVSGLYFNNTSKSYVGLFGYVGSSGTVKNVGIVDSYFRGNEYVGGVCGWNDGTIENSYNRGAIGRGYKVGGVCGNNYTGTITNCYSSATVSGSEDVGGVNGYNKGGTITNCYYDSNIYSGEAVGSNDGTVSDNVLGKGTDGFASGEVAYLLNGSSSENLVWYQNIDTGTAETYPALDNTHGTVYQCTPCTAVYSNTSNKTAKHSFIPGNDIKTHICEKCCYIQEHSTSTLKYTADDTTDTITVTCGECKGNLGTVTLSVPTENLTYDGNAKRASVDNKVTGVTISDPAITYKKGGVELSPAPTKDNFTTNSGSDAFTFTWYQIQDDETEEKLETAPSAIGSYKLKVEVGETQNYTACSTEIAVPISTLVTEETATLADTNKGKNNWYTGDVTINAPSGYKISSSQTGGTWGASLTVTEDMNGEYTYYLKEDDTGYITGAKQITVKRDTSAPDGEIEIKKNSFKTFFSEISFRLFFKNNVDVIITAEDKGEVASGNCTVEYQKVAKADEYNPNGRWVSGNSLSVSAGEAFVLYAKIIDEAGNTSIINSDGVVVYTDAAQNTKKITYTKTTKADVAAEVTLNGNTIKDVNISSTGESGNLTEPVVLTKGTNYTLNEEGNQITLIGDYLDTLTAGDYIITVSYKPLGMEYKENVDTAGKDLNEAPDTTTIALTVELAEGSVTNIAGLSKTYDGKAVGVPAFTTTNDTTDEDFVQAEYKLKNAEDSAYTTTAPKDAGTYLVRITVAGDENYKEASATAEFTISPKDITKAEVTLGDSLTFNGKAQTQTIKSVAIGESEEKLTLTAGDYEVSGATQTDAGNYTLTVTGKGNFTGSATKDFTIAKADASAIADVERKYCYLTGSWEKTESVDIAALLPEDRGDTTYELAANDADYVTDKEVSEDGKLTYKVSAQKSAGAAITLTVTAKSKNYKDITVNVVITLIEQYVTVEEPEAKVVITSDNVLTYGQKLSNLILNTEEAVFVVDGNTKMEVLGTLAWTNLDAVLDAGTTEAEWTFTPSEPTIYKTLTGKLAIQVKKATPNVTAVPTVAERTYNPNVALKDSDLTDGTVLNVNGKTLTGAWGWEHADVVPTVNNDGYTAVFTPTGEDKDNYETITKTITVNVSKATPYIKTVPIASAITYGQTLDDSTLSGAVVQYGADDETKVAGTFTWKEAAEKPAVADSGITKYTVVFNPTDTVNYNTAETEIILTVNKAENAPDMPGNTMSVPYTTRLVSEITTLPANWSWQDDDKNTELIVSTAVTATAVYNGTDKGNYATESVEISITRQACDHKGCETEVKNDKAATCTEKGYIGDTYCKVCQDVITKGKEIVALGHDLQQTAAKIEATCTTDGKEAVKGCSRCDYTEGGEKINALGHHFADAFTVDKEPTCKEAGSKSKHCSRCEEKTEVTEIPKKEHTWDSGKVTKDATCTEKGVKTFACTVAGCDGTKTEEIEALGHDYASEFTVDKEPTCKEAGSKSKHCSRCDAKTEVTEIAKADHTWDAGKVTKEPTETAEGEKTYTCTACGGTKTETIPKKEAAVPQPPKDDTVTPQPPKQDTVTSESPKADTVTPEPPKQDTVTPEQPKKGDVVADDKASAKVEVADATKKEVEYKAPANKKAKTVTIPAAVKIDGVTYKVTKIDDNAFKGNKTVTKVTIGSNIKTIGKNAFSGATKLKKVTIGKNVKEIEANAFKGCSSLTSITLPSNVTKIGANAFSGCKKLKTITIKSTKLTSKTVAKNAFKGLTKETTIKVPKKKLEAYKKLFKSKGLSSEVEVKRY